MCTCILCVHVHVCVHMYECTDMCTWWEEKDKERESISQRSASGYEYDEDEQDFMEKINLFCWGKNKS